MAPVRKWDDEEEDSTPPSSPPPAVRRGKFEDEEDEDDVLESWEAADDSETEREKAKKAAEAKEKAEAEARANKKSKAQRIEERRQQNLRRRLEEDGEDSSEDEDEAERRARMIKSEKESDLKHAEDLFAAASGPKARTAGKPVTVQDPNDPANTIDLASLKIFNPQTKTDFTKLRETLVPLLAGNVKKAQYSLFLQEFAKQIAKDLPSNEIKKISSGLTTLSNEKMKEEKLAEKGGKKSKAAKNKPSVVATRDTSFRADTTSYADDFGDDDFM